MEFRLLGPVEVRHDGRSMALGAPRQQALLAALLLNANVTVSLDQLIAAVWETPPQAPESNVRTFVARLRQRFREPTAICTSSPPRSTATSRHNRSSRRPETSRARRGT